MTQVKYNDLIMAIRILSSKQTVNNYTTGTELTQLDFSDRIESKRNSTLEMRVYLCVRK